MTSGSKDIILLLGAGASAEADIPVSGAMIGQVEEALRLREDWQPFNALYNHVKSAIHFSAGLKGKFDNGVQFNIETLVNTLYELERNEEHPLYPFIASWNSRFVSLAGNAFCNVRKLRRLILAALKKWMCPENVAKANYYRGLIQLQKDLNYPLRTFSLNYDLCVERLRTDDFRIETGFADFGPDHPWDWERFEDMESSNNATPQLVLYKLHGSINWKRKPDTKELFCVEQIESVDEESMDVIFGRDFKLEAADPYLFFAYEFRRFTLLTKLVVVVGYGFGDAHINKMLTQSIRSDRERRIVVVQACDGEDTDERAKSIAASLELSGGCADQIIVMPGTAKCVFESKTLAQDLTALIPKSGDAPF